MTKFSGSTTPEPGHPPLRADRKAASPDPYPQNTVADEEHDLPGHFESHSDSSFNKHDIKEELFCRGEDEPDSVRQELIKEYRNRYPEIMPEIEPIVVEFWNYLPGTGENSISGYDTESLIQAAFEGFDFANVDEVANYTNPRERSVVGPYKVLDILGEGGMGLVYLAEDPKNQQKVAIKTLRSTALIDPIYLDNEQKSLAKLNHSYIAHLKHTFMGDDNIQYIVMEYVDGIKIDDYCDNHKLSVRERVLLFKKLCEGVLHAHEHGLMHLDLKPMNILVKQENQKAVPKIIDFGISQIKDHIDHYLGGVRGPGTPAYMSPEQTIKRRNELTQKCDVYSLGVILYELLCGRVPLAEELKSVDSSKKMEMVRTLEPKTLEEETRDVVNLDLAEKRSTTPTKLIPQLKGELTWIVTRALHKDPERRYSLQALIADLEAYLDGKEVAAGSHDRSYRWKHFVLQQQKLLSTAASLFIGVIVLAMWLQNSQAIAKQNRQLAEQNEKIAKLEEARAESGQDLVNVLLEQVSPYFGSEKKEVIEMDELLARLSEKLNTAEAKKDRERNYNQRLMLGRTLTDIGLLEASNKELTHLLENAEAWWGNESRQYFETLSYLEYTRTLLNPKESNPDRLKTAIQTSSALMTPTHPTVLRLHAARGAILYANGRHNLDEAVTELETALAGVDRNKKHPPVFVYSALLNKGAVHLEKSDLNQAARDFKRVRKMYTNNIGRIDPFFGRINFLQGRLCYRRKDYQRAGKFMTEAHEIFYSRLGPDNRETQNADLYLKFFIPAAQGDVQNIPKLLETLSSLSLKPRYRLSAMSQLVDSLIKEKAWDKAKPWAEKNRQEARKVFGEDSKNELVTRINLAAVKYGMGQREQAQNDVDTILDLAEKLGMRRTFAKAWNEFLRNQK